MARPDGHICLTCIRYNIELDKCSIPEIAKWIEPYEAVRECIDYKEKDD